MLKQSACLVVCTILSAACAEPLNTELISTVEHIAIEARVPQSIALRLMLEESAGQADAVSKRTTEGYYSVGLFQLYMRPSNIQWLLEAYWFAYAERERFNPYNPLHSTKVGLRYLRSLYERFGSWTHALWYYNCGRSTNPPEATRAYAARIVCEHDAAVWRAKLK